MEIVGVIAAVPELAKLVRRTGVAVGQISSKTRMSKVTQGIQNQLDLLAEILETVQQRHETPLNSNRNSRLAPVLKNVRDEVTSLQRLVDTIEGSTGGRGLFKRAQLVLSGFEKKFQESKDRLESLVSLLQLYLTESATQAKHRTQLRKLLRPSTTDFIPKKLKGTLEWTWSHEIFKTWTREAKSGAVAPDPSQPNNRVLVIYGMKGSGKSVLAASTVEDLKNKGATTLFFSFWSGHSQQRRTEDMLRTLLWQLIESLPEDLQNRHIPRLLENQANLNKLDFLTLELHKMAQDHSPEIYCVLDGIDESADDWNSIKDGPLDCLTRILQTIRHIRLLLIGRQSSLRTALHKWPLHIELTRDLVHGDLSRFISSELDYCPNMTDDEIRNKVQEELESKSSVMFLWIALVFKELRLSFSPTEISCTLRRLPTELDGEYSRLFSMLMKRLSGQPKVPSVGMIRAKGLLSILVGASRPLTIMELRLAYAFASPTSPDSSYSENLISEEGVIDACGDLITTNGHLIYLGHTSIREFLLRPREQWDSQDDCIAYFHLEPKACQRMIGLACLRYLQHVDWEDLDRVGSVQELTRRYPLLRYVSGYMNSHLMDSDLSTNEVSDDITALSSSVKFHAWVKFVILSESQESHDTMLPIHFWDEAAQFWGAWIGPRSLIGPSDSDSGGRGEFMMMIGNYLTTPIVRGQDDESSSKAVAEGDRSTTISPGLQNATSTIKRNHPSLTSRLLPLILPTLNSILVRTQALVDPLDLLLQSIERCQKGMSFLSLMAFGHLIERTRPKQASRIYQSALLKVIDRGDLQEAWAHWQLALCYRDLRDPKKKEQHYERAATILEGRPVNLFNDGMWEVAAIRHSRCLFESGRADEAEAVACRVEKRLFAGSGPSSRTCGRRDLRQWCSQRLESSNFFTRAKTYRICSLGSLYYDEGLWEDAGRVLEPLTRAVPNLRLLEEDDFFRNAELTGNTMEYLEKNSEAREFWAKAARLVNQDTPPGQAEANFFKFHVALCWGCEGKLEEAETELASIDIPLLLKHGDGDYDTIEEHVYDVVRAGLLAGEKDKTMEALQGLICALETASIEDGMQLTYESMSISRDLLAHGRLAECESFTRHRLSHLPPPETPDSVDDEDSVNEFLARGYLAYAMRLQERPDAYEGYLAAISLEHAVSSRIEENGPHVGLGMICAATGRSSEAAKAFEKVAMRFQGQACGFDCTFLCFHLFFSVLAKRQRKDMEGAKSLPSLLDDLEDDMSFHTCCECPPPKEDVSILAVDGFMQLAEECDERGSAPEADGFRNKALEMLLERFDHLLDPEVALPRFGWYLQKAKWARRCRDHILGRQKGEIGADVRCDMFPYEAWWYGLYHRT